MADRFDELLEKAKGGDEAALAALAEALLSALGAGGADAERALAVLRAAASQRSAALRKTAASVAAERADAAVAPILLQLASDRDEGVRGEILDSAKASGRPLPDDVLAKLIDDGEDVSVRCGAIELASGRATLAPAVARRLREDAAWVVKEVAARTLTATAPRDHFAAFLDVSGTHDDDDVIRACAGGIEAALGPDGRPPEGAELPRPPVLRKALDSVRKYAQGKAPRAEAWLAQVTAGTVDRDELRAFGADLTAEAEAGRLPHGWCSGDACDLLEEMLAAEGPRAVVLLGESGTGKTAVIHELVHRLRRPAAGAWIVLRVSPSDLLSGTVYLGEWQTKVRDLIRATERPRRVLVYIPDIGQLADAGRSSRSDLNIASMLLPYIEKGQLAVLGESTPDAFQDACMKAPGLRRAFRPVELRAASTAATLSVLRAVRDEARARLSDGVIDRLMDLTDYYLPGMAQPGRSVGLLRRVLAAARDTTAEIGVRDVLATLSGATGIPADLLDDAVPLDPEQVREFFQARVMGQPEAVDAVADLVTLVKAGLNDPGKPFGVLLFVGPTGVGKTELARALAEFLFGDAARLVRLDMSEFASYEGFERLLGKGGDGLLTRPVQEQPFSVVLLDEIEKSHVNVFDLCLQLFDAGRLTDGAGRTVDFRRTIVILTSNVGSAVATDAPVGFAGSEPPGPDPDDTLRELRRSFRPEFLNRIDRIVHFRPLGLDTAERIARREVARVLERSGITRRGLVVDVGADVVALLLRQGYSRALGARPLKRIVERVVLLPVARVVARGAAASGSVLRLRARGDAVTVEVVRTEQVAEAPAPDAGAASVLRAAENLRTRVEALRPPAEAMAARKSDAVAKAGEATTWKDRAAARALMDRVHRLESILTSWERLDRTAADLARRAAKLGPGPAKGGGIARSIEDAAAEADRLAPLLAAGDGPDLGDAIVVLTRTNASGGALHAVERIAGMVRGFAKSRGLETSVLDDRVSDDPPEDTVALLVEGGGAFGVLRGEAGLHLVSKSHPPRGREPPSEDREAVRVEVFPAPADETAPGAGVRTDSIRLRGVKSRLGGALEHDARVFDERSLATASARSADSKKDAAAKAWTILRARLASPAAPDTDSVRRRYVLGPSPVVRDLRSGRSSGNLDRVLRGELALVAGAPVTGDGPVTRDGPR